MAVCADGAGSALALKSVLLWRVRRFRMSSRKASSRTTTFLRLIEASPNLGASRHEPKSLHSPLSNGCRNSQSRFYSRRRRRGHGPCFVLANWRWGDGLPWIQTSMKSCSGRSRENTPKVQIPTEGFLNQLAFSVWDRRVDELAMFTDGLERLALQFREQAVHTLFLLQMFEICETPSIQNACSILWVDFSTRTTSTNGRTMTRP